MCTCMHKHPHTHMYTLCTHTHEYIQTNTNTDMHPHPHSLLTSTKQKVDKPTMAMLYTTNTFLISMGLRDAMMVGPIATKMK